jgi:hypothetical protein
MCRFQLKEVGSQVSVRTAQSCIQTPISVEKLRIVQGSICLDVMATCLDALQSSRRIRFSFTDMYMGRQLHPTGRQCNTVRTRSIIRLAWSRIVTIRA